MFKDVFLLILDILNNPVYMFWVSALSILMAFVGKIILYVDKNGDL